MCHAMQGKTPGRLLQSIRDVLAVDTDNGATGTARAEDTEAEDARMDIGRPR